MKYKFGADQIHFRADKTKNKALIRSDNKFLIKLLIHFGYYWIDITTLTVDNSGPAPSPSQVPSGSLLT